MVVYAAAANKRARQDEEEASTSSSSSANAAALFLHAASAPPPFGDFEPISAVPISAVPPQQLPPVSGREEPPCLREHLLKGLGLRADLPVHFIDDKRLTGIDLWTRTRTGSASRGTASTPPTSSSSREPREESQDGPVGGKKIKKPKAKGKVHGGLRVNLVGLDGGAKQELLLSRWDSSHATVVKGEGYLDFARRCGFREGDAVEVWAFVQRRFRLFGEDVCGDSLLHVLVVKKDQQPARCATATALSSLLHPRSIHRS
ncbi:hypothetical protein GQ55_5G207900 [Panicum hallii var. hallii]|uniref:Uncharacterized protein n=1 Tax=Panicum hallii var. hallii TaxID=1504633 RepID=A0A2T7DIH8_9POAL|nr:hypothetical protein GQ55_5G207900 [Panicum hallii var. hallii]